MNRNFILGCLAGAIGGMLGTWALLFIDIKISTREVPVLNINTGYSVSTESTEEISINQEDGVKDAVGVLVNDGLFEEINEEFKERGEFGLVLIPYSNTNTPREREGVHVVISPVSTCDLSARAKVIGFSLLDRREDHYYKK